MDSESIAAGRAILGIELGSTRIKACLIDSAGATLGVGSHAWENQYVDHRWTYSLDAVWHGLQSCYADLVNAIESNYGVRPDRYGAIGISAMMHGYLCFDSADELLVPFRTWRNTSTEAAAEELSALFGFNIPLRWSIAHLYQAVLDEEPHVSDVTFLTTLAGYVHWRLTGTKVLGVGDASGMFPIDQQTHSYDERMAEQFDELVAAHPSALHLRDLLPEIRLAGQEAGTLTQDGAALLDPSGRLRPGIPFCPPEGDAGTGMVATNSVAPRTANVSVGTSIFAMVVLDRRLTSMHPELDLVTTPVGDEVAMVHCNNGASELGAWSDVFAEFASVAGARAERDEIFAALLSSALDGEPDAGGLVAYNYLSGEPITDVANGRPLIVRTPDSRLSLANFMRAQVYSVFATLSLGIQVLAQEGVHVDEFFAHGGLFRTAAVAQRYLAAAVDAPVVVGETSSEGGAWGMAVLAAYLGCEGSQPLGAFLNERIFSGFEATTIDPDSADAEGFRSYLARYSAGLPVERSAGQHF